MTLPTAIEKLRQACQQVLEAHEKATPAPWRTGPINYNDVYAPGGEIVALAPKHPEGHEWNGEIITLSRNLSPIMARLLLALCDESDKNGVSDELQDAIIQAAESLNGGKSQ